MRKFDTTGLCTAVRSAGSPTSGMTVGFDAVLDEFVAELQSYCRDEKNIAERTRTLHYARSELMSFMDTHASGSKKKCAGP